MTISQARLVVLWWVLHQFGLLFAPRQIVLRSAAWLHRRACPNQPCVACYAFPSLFDPRNLRLSEREMDAVEILRDGMAHGQLVLLWGDPDRFVEVLDEMLVDRRRQRELRLAPFRPAP